MFRLSVVFPCQPGRRVAWESHTSLLVQLWVPSTACEQGLSPCHHEKLFVSGLCPQPQLVLTWWQAVHGQGRSACSDLVMLLSSLRIIDQSLIKSTADCWSF